MMKKIIFSLLFFLLSTKSLSAENCTRGTMTQRLVTSGKGFVEDAVTGIIIERKIIEWKTISKTRPVCGMSFCAVAHCDTLNQIGTEYLVKFAQIEWKGVIKEFELERTLIKSDTVLERQISD